MQATVLPALSAVGDYDRPPLTPIMKLYEGLAWFVAQINNLGFSLQATEPCITVDNLCFRTHTRRHQVSTGGQNDVQFLQRLAGEDPRAV